MQRSSRPSVLSSLQKLKNNFATLYVMLLCIYAHVYWKQLYLVLPYLNCLSVTQYSLFLETMQRHKISRPTMFESTSNNIAFKCGICDYQIPVCSCIIKYVPHHFGHHMICIADEPSWVYLQTIDWFIYWKNYWIKLLLCSKAFLTLHGWIGYALREKNIFYSWISKFKVLVDTVDTLWEGREDLP